MESKSEAYNYLLKGKGNVAIPYKEGMVNPHFGQSEFIIWGTRGSGCRQQNYSTKTSAITMRTCWPRSLRCRCCDHRRKANDQALQAVGFEVITGATGDAAKVASDYLNGSLETANIGICGCGNHDHHGHGCWSKKNIIVTVLMTSSINDGSHLFFDLCIYMATDRSFAVWLW